MRICLFTPTFLPLIGGTEVVTDALARHFTAKGHRAVVLAHGDPGEPTDRERDYPVVRYRKPAAHRFFPERIGRHLAELHRAERFDIVAANYGVPTGFAAVRFGRRTGVPIVVISHGGDLYRSSMRRSKPHLWRRLVAAYRGADGLITISPYIETLIREIVPDPRRIEMIPNGVDVADLRRPVARPDDVALDRPFALCLGNLGPMKGFDDAIVAYAEARPRLGDLALAIVGGGPLDADLRRRVRELGLDGHVRFFGPRTGDAKRWFLRTCRFGVMPSIEEGHPIVGLEFLATGKPLVCSTNAAFDTMYDDGVNAFRVPARDPAALATALIRMHEADIETMGRRSADRADDSDWSLVADRYLAFFARVVDEAGPAAAGAASASESSGTRSAR